MTADGVYQLPAPPPPVESVLSPLDDFARRMRHFAAANGMTGEQVGQVVAIFRAVVSDG
jgi:hypothetical protein